MINTPPVDPSLVKGWLTARSLARGQLPPGRDQQKIDQFWTGAVDAWFPKGKADPTLTLLRMDCDDAELWLTDANAMRFGFAMAKANLTGHPPDVTVHTHLRLS